MPRPVPIDPVKLVDAADVLIDHHAGKGGRPRSVWLRRAVSTAYYALFHAICLEAAQHLLPSGRTDHQLAMARAFGHREIKTCCEWIAGRRGGIQGPVLPIVRGLKAGSVVDVADSFCDLQEARHRADYDHLALFPKATASALVLDARRSITRLDGASAQERDALFSLLALRSRMMR